MKYTIFFLLFCFQLIYGQSINDIIIKKDSSSIEGIVLKVTDKNIELDPIGDIPFIIIDRKEVKKIIYHDSTIVKFDDKKLTSASKVFQEN